MIFKYRKIVGSRGFAPDPTGGAHSAFPDPLADSVSHPQYYEAYATENAYLQRKKLAKWVSPPLPYAPATCYTILCFTQDTSVLYA